jgi:hypothetical protein
MVGMTRSVVGSQTADEQEPPAPARAARRRWPRWLAWTLAAWVLAAGLPLLLAAIPLGSARAAAVDAQAALAEGRMADAAERLTAARSGFRLGRYVLRNPVAWVGGLLPVGGSSTRLAGDLAYAGHLAADAALGSLDAVMGLPDGFGSLLPSDGRVPLEPLASIAPALRRSADDLALAAATVESAPSLLVPGPLARARAQAVEELAPAAEGAAAAAALAEQLPGLLGGDGARRYFLGASNPAELRGSGGFVGAYAVLEVDDGQVDIGGFRPIHDLGTVPAGRIDPPSEEFAGRYDRFGGAGFWMNLNLSRDFPTVASAIMRLYQRVEGERLDGVVIVDPHALSVLLELSGPQRVATTGVEVTAGNVVAYVTNEAYGQFDANEERKDVLGDVAAAALAGLLRGEVAGDATAAMTALGRAAARGHILVHAADPGVQRALVAAGVAGQLPVDEGSLLAVVQNSASASKVDYYLEQTLAAEIVLRPDGSAQVDLELELRNGAPTEGPPGHVIGPNAPGLEAGDHLALLSLYCAPCVPQAARIGGRDAEVRVGTELGAVVVDTDIHIPAGGQRAVTYALEIPGAWQSQELGTAGRYRLTIRGQNRIIPSGARVTVVLPEGFHLERIRADGLAVTATDGRLLLEGPSDGDLVLDVRFVTDVQSRAWARVRELLARPVLRF